MIWSELQSLGRQRVAIPNQVQSLQGQGTGPVRNNEAYVLELPGLGNVLEVRGLLRCQKSEDADILLLSEKKIDEKRMLFFLKKKLEM